MIVKLNKMVEEGMAERSWADSIIKKKFEEPIASEDLKDPVLRSVMFFYEVISLRCLCS